MELAANMARTARSVSFFMAGFSFRRNVSIQNSALRRQLYTMADGVQIRGAHRKQSTQEVRVVYGVFVSLEGAWADAAGLVGKDYRSVQVVR